MLLDYDVVADGKTQPGAFAGRLGSKERIEHLVFNVGWNTNSIVTNCDLYAVAKILR